MLFFFRKTKNALYLTSVAASLVACTQVKKKVGVPNRRRRERRPKDIAKGEKEERKKSEN